MKNVKDRLQAIGAARTRIQEMIAEPEALTGGIETAPYPLWKKLAPWAAVLLLTVGFRAEAIGHNDKADGIASRVHATRG